MGLTDTLGVPGENDNGRRVMEFCAERLLYVGKTYIHINLLSKVENMQGI